MRHSRRTVAFLAAIASLGLLAPAAIGQTTTWIGSVGDWGTGANWSNGVPTADVDAVVPASGTPTVTLNGEVCRNLLTGTSAGGSTLRIQTGSLNVVTLLNIGAVVSGSFQQTFGTLTAGELAIGTTGIGACTFTGGTQTLGRLRVGSSALSSGTYSMVVTTPVCTIAESLAVPRGGSFVCGAGTLSVGTAAGQGARIDGAFTLNNTPTVAMKGFVMSSTGILSVGVGQFGVSTIMVNGTAVLDGQLIIQDILATNGTYEVLRGNPLQGGFSSATLPADWSWHIEGNSLFLVKGPVPVVGTSWSGIKARFER